MNYAVFMFANQINDKELCYNYVLVCINKDYGKCFASLLCTKKVLEF